MPFYNEKIPRIKNINLALDSLDDEGISQRYNEMNTERQMINKYYIDDLYIAIAELFGNENPCLLYTSQLYYTSVMVFWFLNSNLRFR